MYYLPDRLDSKDPAHSSSTSGLASMLSRDSPSLSSVSGEDFQEALAMADGENSTAPNLDSQETTSQKKNFDLPSPAMLTSHDEVKLDGAVTVEHKNTQKHLSNGNDDITVVTADTDAQLNGVDGREIDKTYVALSDCTANTQGIQYPRDIVLSIDPPTVEDRNVVAQPADMNMISSVEAAGDSSQVCSEIENGTVDHKTETSSSDGHSGHTITSSDMSSFATEYPVESDKAVSREVDDTKVENPSPEEDKDPKTEAGVNTRSLPDESSGDPDHGCSHRLQDSRWMTPPDQMDSQVRSSNNFVPRPYPHQQYYNAYRDRDELRRVQTLLVKTQQDLRAQREENRMLKMRIEAQPHEKTNVGLLGLFQEVIDKYADLQENKAGLARKELELRARTAAVKRMEVFLSEGQKQLKNRLEETGVRTANELQLEHARAEGEATAKQKYQSVDTSLVDRLQKADIREAELDFRQQHWKIDTRDSLEAEIRESLRSEIYHEISEVVYGQGFQAGKAAGLAENIEDTKQEGFLQGYQTAQNMQEKLAALKKGHISHDSVELEFIFDFSHPQNPFNLGRQLGSREPASNPSYVPFSYPNEHLSNPGDRPPLHRPSFYAQIAGAKFPKYNNTNNSTSPAGSIQGRIHDNRVNDAPPYTVNVEEPHARTHDANGYVSRSNGSIGSITHHHVVDRAMHYLTETNNQHVNVDGQALKSKQLAKAEKNVSNLIDI